MGQLYHKMKKLLFILLLFSAFSLNAQHTPWTEDLTPLPIPEINISTDLFPMWDASAARFVATRRDSLGLSTSHHTDDNFTTLVPATTPVVGSRALDRRRGSTWWYDGSAWNKLTIDNGMMAEIPHTPGPNNPLSANLYNRYFVALGSAGTTVSVPTPTNLAGQEPGEYYVFEFQGANVSGTTLEFDRTTFKKGDGVTPLGNYFQDDNDWTHFIFRLDLEDNVPILVNISGQNTPSVNVVDNLTELSALVADSLDKAFVRTHGGWWQHNGSTWVQFTTMNGRNADIPVGVNLVSTWGANDGTNLRATWGGDLDIVNPAVNYPENTIVTFLFTSLFDGSDLGFGSKFLGLDSLNQDVISNINAGEKVYAEYLVDGNGNLQLIHLKMPAERVIRSFVIYPGNQQWSGNSTGSAKTDSIAFFYAGEEMTGYTLRDIHWRALVAGSGTGSVDVQINVSGNTSSNTAATNWAATDTRKSSLGINLPMTNNEVFMINYPINHTITTLPKGLFLELVFEKD